MLSRKRPRQATCFIPGSLADYIPTDHLLKQVEALLDLSWLEQEVAGRYSPDNGRPCIPPEQALRLMLAGFFHGVVQDRKLMREAQVNLAYRWFAGYELDEPLPDHSSLTRIRQRWGAETFARIFARVVAQCVEAGLVGGEALHLDATLIRADVSWESLVTVHVAKVLAENQPPAQEEPPADSPPPPGGAKTKKVSRTDPAASLTTSCKQQRMEPCYKQHAVVDDKAGVIVDVKVTSGAVSEGRELRGQLERAKAQTGSSPALVTADQGYASAANYAALEESSITAVIPPQPESKRHRGLPAARLRYDAQQRRVRCPAGKTLERKGRIAGGWSYRAKAKDCGVCRRRAGCLAPTVRARVIYIKDGYSALLRARRKKLQGWSPTEQQAYRRHRWRIEGMHGEAKCQHGLRRAVRRGLANVSLQAYLTAVVINLKRLACRSRTLANLLRKLIMRGISRKEFVSGRAM